MQCFLPDILKVSRVLDDDAVFEPVNGHKCSPQEEGSTAYGFLASSSIVLMPSNDSVLIFIPYNEYVWNVHVAFLPSCRGKAAKNLTLSGFGWMFKHTTCRKIIGFMSKKRRDGLAYVRSLRVKEEGLLADCDGEGTSMVVFGLTKGDFYESGADLLPNVHQVESRVGSACGDSP